MIFIVVAFVGGIIFHAFPTKEPTRNRVKYEMIRIFSTCYHPIVKPIIKKVFADPKPYELYNLDSAVEIKKNVNILH